MKRRHLSATLTLIALLTSLGGKPARAVDPDIPPPFTLGETTAGALQATTVPALLGLVGVGIGELMQSQKNKTPFVPGHPVAGWAYGATAGALMSGPYLALYKDPAQPWLSAVSSSVAGGLVAGALLWAMTSLRADVITANEWAFAGISLSVPAAAALTSALTYHFVRQFERPAPAPTPTPLTTPWPSPTPPVRLWH